MSLALLKALEKEVVAFAESYGIKLRPRVHPRQLLGLETNAYAVELASIVIWIGYLQWKHHNVMPLDDEDPILQPLNQVRLLDAVVERPAVGAPIEPAWPAAEQQLEAARALQPAYLRAVFESDELERWPRVPIGEVCEIVAALVDPTMPQYSQLPHVSAENIVSGEARLVDVKTAEQDGMISGKCTFDAGDVLYSKLRPYLRKVAVAAVLGLCSADMYPLRANAEQVDAHFLALVLLSDEFTRYADGESRRTRMPKLNRDQLFRWKMSVPLLDVQRSKVKSVMDGFVGSRRLQSGVREGLSAIDHLHS